jgi:hypothetical protein
MPLNADFLRAITPRYTSRKDLGETQRQTIEAIGPILQQTLNDQGLNTDLRAVHSSRRPVTKPWACRRRQGDSMP